MALKRNIATSETGFIFNPATGDSFSANPVAAEILLMMKENKSPSAIKKAIHEKYEVDKTQLEKDYEDLLAQLRDFNLLDS